MKVILDVKENRADFFMELIKSLEYINVLKEVKTKEKSQAMQDIIEGFGDVELHKEGKLELKSAKDLLNEL